MSAEGIEFVKDPKENSLLKKTNAQTLGLYGRRSVRLTVTSGDLAVEASKPYACTAYGKGVVNREQIKGPYMIGKGSP